MIAHITTCSNTVMIFVDSDCCTVLSLVKDVLILESFISEPIVAQLSPLYEISFRFFLFIFNYLQAWFTR